MRTKSLTGPLIYVSANAVPKRCPSCGVEVVYHDGVHVTYSTVREMSNGAGKFCRFAGYEHRCGEEKR